MTQELGAIRISVDDYALVKRLADEGDRPIARQLRIIIREWQATASPSCHDGGHWLSSMNSASCLCGDIDYYDPTKEATPA